MDHFRNVPFDYNWTRMPYLSDVHAVTFLVESEGLLFLLVLLRQGPHGLVPQHYDVHRDHEQDAD